VLKGKRMRILQRKEMKRLREKRQRIPSQQMNRKLQLKKLGKQQQKRV
jgi:hypothetical protein